MFLSLEVTSNIPLSIGDINLLDVIVGNSSCDVTEDTIDAGDFIGEVGMSAKVGGGDGWSGKEVGVVDGWSRKEGVSSFNPSFFSTLFDTEKRISSIRKLLFLFPVCPSIPPSRLATLQSDMGKVGGELA